MWKKLIFVIVSLQLFMVIVFIYPVSVDPERSLRGGNSIQNNWERYYALEIEETKGKAERSSVPAYYINLDRSPERQRYMEEYVGRLFTSFTRVEAVDGRNSTAVSEWVGEYSGIYTNQTVGEVSLAASHMKAIWAAYDAGHKNVVILEDDVSIDLVPFWRYSLDDFTDNVWKSDNEWEAVRLQYSMNEFLHPYLTWFQDPSLLVRPFDDCCFGTVAYLISRLGMEKLISRHTAIAGNGRKQLKCVREYNVKCASDWIIPSCLNLLYATPPLFAVRVMEGSTGVREAETSSDHNGSERAHSQSFLSSLQWNIEAAEMERNKQTSTDSLPPFHWKLSENRGVPRFKRRKRWTRLK